MLVADVRRCLETLDVAEFKPMWDHFFPHLPCPHSDADCIVAMHMARTQARSINTRARFYSHRWLVDHGYPSMLPDHMRARAERVYPRIAEGVGIACAASNPIMKPIVPYVRAAMEQAVLDCFANGDRDSEIVRSRMLEARSKTVKKLTGIMLAGVRRGTFS